MSTHSLAHRAVHEYGAIQKEPELTELIQRLDGVPLRRVLEIGSERGGSFWLWCQLATPDAQLQAVDLAPCCFFWPPAHPQQSLAYLQADSHRPKTLAAVQATFEEPLDLLFLDGDHSYDGVKQDFETYAPLVADGGLVLLHDIAPHDPSQGCEVDRFWAELDGDKWETTFPHRADIQGGVLPAASCGLGVLRIVR